MGNVENWLMLLAVVAAVVAIGAQAARRSATSRQTTNSQTTTQTTTNASPTPPKEAFPMPTPEIVATEGLSHVPAYVHRLMQAQKQAAVLMISSLEGQEGFSILRMRDGRMQFHLTANWPEASARQHNAQAFFARHNITPQEDLRDGSRTLSFSVSGDTAAVTNLARITMTEVLNIPANAGLKFRYEERDL